MKAIRTVPWVCIVIAFAAVAVLAGAAQLRTTQVNRARKQPASYTDREWQERCASLAEDPLSYCGRGLMFLTPSGLLVFSPGDQIRAHTMGFDLNLDEQALKAALEGEVELVDISGWLEVIYSGQAGVLHVFADDDRGTHFEQDS